MPVSFSSNSDIIMCVTSIGLLLAGALCIAISREQDIDRPLPSWRYLGIALCILGGREWLGVFGLSAPGFVSWYPSTAFMQTTAGLFVLAAARVESIGNSRRLTIVHILVALLLIAILAVIAHPYLSYARHLRLGTPLVFTFVFFAAKALLAGVSLLLVYYTWRNPHPSSLSIKAVPVIFSVFVLMTLFLFPPGLPENPSLIDAAANNLVQVLMLLRIPLSYFMALIIWNVYSKSLGVTNQVRWWPIIFMLFMVFLGVILLWTSAANYEGVVHNNLAAAARNAARSIPADELRETAATSGSANDDAARRIFSRVRDLEYYSGYTHISADADILAYLPDRDDVIPILDIVHHPGGGSWARSGRPVRKYWDDYRSHGTLHYEESESEPMLFMAPLQTDSGEEAGLVVVSVSTTDMMLEMYAYKRLRLLLLPLFFIILLILVSEQQRAWLANHSTNRDEAMRVGALGHGLVGVCIKRGSVIVDVNQRMSEILGVTRTELVGKDTRELSGAVPPETAAELERWSDSLEQAGTACFESVIRRNDGSEVNLLVMGRNIAFSPRESHSIWESVDITRIKEMENDVREARDYLQMVLEMLPVGVFVKDRNGRYQLANRRFASFFDMDSVDDVLGKTAAEIYPEDPTVPQVYDEICIDMRGETLMYDQSFRFDDGGERFFELSKVVRWLGEDRENYVIIGSMHDMTDRKVAENAIKAEQHFLMQLINTLPVSVCFLDKDLVIRLCDNDFCREAGVEEPGDIVGKPYDDVEPFDPLLQDEDLTILARGSGFSDTEFEMEKDGRTRNFILRRSVMQSAKGEVLGLVKTFSDTTALVAANRAAKKADRAKAAFLANMSHELRTPMNGIVGMADLIIDHESTEPVQRLYAETVIKSAKTLQMVMDEVLNVATMEEGDKRFTFHAAPFPMLPLTEEAAQIVGCIVEAWGVELSVAYDFGLPCFLEGDARHIRQIIVQVLTHCSRLSSDKRIRLDIGAGGGKDGGVMISTVFRPAADLGPGELESMFKSADNESSLLKLGMFNNRIGLPLAWHLVKIMGGTLGVTREGDVIRCRIRLPLMAPSGRPADPPTAPDLSQLRVLVATPDRERSAAIRRALDYAHADTTVIDNRDSIAGELTNAVQRDRAYELLILDSALVETGGLAAFLEEPLASLPEKPAVMAIVSSHEVQNLGRIGGVLDSLLLPPICPGEVWSKIDALLNDAIGTGKGMPKSAVTRRISRVTRAVRVSAKVLLVEDNTVNQMVAMGILKRIGCTITLAKNGREAVDRVVGGERFDIILMDCMMPIMDGYEATSRIRMHERSEADGKRNIIIALTANTVAGDREKCLAAGMDDYTTKPVTLELLRDVIMKHCPWLGLAVEGNG